MKKRSWTEHLQKKNKINKILDRASIVARTPILPCEDRDRVAKSLLNVVDGDIDEEVIGETRYLVIRTSGRSKIERLFNYFRSKQTLAALRKFLLKYSTNHEIIFYLHKQAAFNGVLSLAEPGESPGGEIIVIISVDESDEIIKWLTRF